MNKSLIGLMIIAALAGALLVAGLSSRTEPSSQQVPLPDIAGDFFTTVIYDESPESRRLLRYFQDDPTLNRIRNRERHNELASTDPYYVENFKPRLKEANSFPLFLIQRPNGDSCLILSKDTIPDSSEELVGHIRRKCQPGPDRPIKKVVTKVKENAPLIVDTVKKIATGGSDTGSIIALILSSLGSMGWLTRSLKESL